VARYTICFVLLLLASAQALRWPAEVESNLSTSEVVAVKSLWEEIEDWDGSNDYHLFTLADGTKAVFRSEDEPWGSQAEVAAYRFDQLLGTELVPPTVPRTLHKGELGERWPWESESRIGSMQLFVEGARSAIAEDLKQPDLANSEILSFLLGRYDNHSGNLLVAPDGRLVVIDFEGSLDVQQVRYGEFPFLRRGGWHEGGLDGSKPFPFDSPSKLVDPTLQEIQATFGPWWGQHWAQGMKGLHGLLRGIPDRTVPYVVWDSRLWVQVPVRSRHPAYTDVYPKETLEAFDRLDEKAIQSLFGPPFGEAQISGFRDRLKQLSEAARQEVAPSRTKGL
jgi:hypothetical protein